MSKKDDAKEGAAELKKLTEAVELALPAKKTPHKRHIIDPKVGVLHQFKKGHKRPGPGRPKARPGLMTEALQRRLAMKFPAKYAVSMKIPKGLTWADAVAWTALYGVVKAPSAEQFDGYANRADGRQVREISGPGGAPIPLDLVAGEAHDEIRSLRERVRDRVQDSPQP